MNRKVPQEGQLKFFCNIEEDGKLYYCILKIHRASAIGIVAHKKGQNTI